MTPSIRATHRLNLAEDVGVEEGPLKNSSIDQVWILYSTFAFLAVMVHAIGLKMSFLNMTPFRAYQIFHNKFERLCGIFGLQALCSVPKVCNHE